MDLVSVIVTLAHIFSRRRNRTVMWWRMHSDIFNESRRTVAIFLVRVRIRRKVCAVWVVVSWPWGKYNDGGFFLVFIVAI